MITNALSFIVRREGRKFLCLAEPDEQTLSSLLAIGSREMALYVHIPFCRTLCPFCCFNRYLFSEEKARPYFKALRGELDMYLDHGFRFPSVYFGGGTPPILMDELLAFVSYLKRKTPVKEISLESTPAEINRRTVELLRQAGVNRLSIGVQSFDNAVLKAMGRVTGSAEEARERVLMAQGQFDTVNVDLIFNFPFQSTRQFEADVQTFKDLKIDQATFYPLMASPHKRSVMERRFNRVDTRRERQFYDIILHELLDDGYTPSTAWCFSRSDHMIDEYIVQFDDYVGIGAGSVSIVGSNFYVNSFSLERYADFLNNGRLPVIGVRTLTEKEALRYYLLTSLFGGSLDKERLEGRFGSRAESKLGLEIQGLRALGFIRGNERLEITRRGMFPVSVMMRDFFASLNGLREKCIEEQV